MLAGIYLGAGIPEDWSLGFAIPLSSLALLIPGLRSPATLGAALTGGVIAVLAVGLPYNLGLLAGALGGIIAGLLLERLQKGRTVHPVADENREQEAAVVLPDRQADFDWMNPQIPAAILAGLVAWRTRSTLLTLGVGMGALWALKHWGL